MIFCYVYQKKRCSVAISSTTEAMTPETAAMIVTRNQPNKNIVLSRPQNEHG